MTNIQSTLTKISTGLAANAVQVPQHMSTINVLTVSPQTVRYVVKLQSFRAVIKMKKLLLTTSILEQAAEWAVEDWKSVVWLYGTKINSIESDGKQWLGNWVGEGLIEQGPENSGILMVGTSWYGSLWTGMLL